MSKKLLEDSPSAAISPLKIPLFLALDVDDDVAALRLADITADFVGGFKVGPRLTYRYGARLIEELGALRPVFVDNKYHDIPSTVTSALRATFEAGASFATVHASNGTAALQEIARLEEDLRRQRFFRVLVVTVLTSFSPSTLPRNWQADSIEHHTQTLARDAIEAGLLGLVCSPHEVRALRMDFPEAYLVTPGIRLPSDSLGDQTRIQGPREALKAGASALVVGRPIIESPNPRQAAEVFYRAISNS